MCTLLTDINYAMANYPDVSKHTLKIYLHFLNNIAHNSHSHIPHWAALLPMLYNDINSIIMLMCVISVQKLLWETTEQNHYYNTIGLLLTVQQTMILYYSCYIVIPYFFTIHWHQRVTAIAFQLLYMKVTPLAATEDAAVKATTVFLYRSQILLQL